MARPEDVFVEELDKQLNDLIDRIFALSQENLVKRHRKDFKSGKSKEVITTDTGMLLKTANVDRSQKLEKSIVYPAPYAENVEFGSSGFPVRPDSLEKWVRRKLFKGKKARPSTVKKVAENIAKSLAQRGQSQDSYLRPAIDQALMEFKLPKVNI